MSSSTGNSPHRFSGSADMFYDPDFTADISKKMRVPEKIMFEDNNGFNDPAIIASKKQSYSADKPIWMTVPERILVMGNDSHMSGREPLPELKLENSLIGMSGDCMTSDFSPLQLSTPPHTLTLSEHNFPTVEDTNYSVQSNGPNSKGAINKRIRNIALSGLNHNTGDDIHFDSSVKESLETSEYQMLSNNSVNDLSEDVLRRQVRALSRRMAALEVENQHRHQREVFVYTVGVIYFLIKGFFWVQRRL